MSARVKLVPVKVRRSHYVGDVAALETYINDGYEIVASTYLGDDTVLYTLVRR